MPPDSASKVFTVRGAVHTGQLKQFLVHLRGVSLTLANGEDMDPEDCDRGLKAGSYLPIPFTLDHPAGDFEQTAWTIPAYDLFNRTSRTSYVVAVFAPH